MIYAKVSKRKFCCIGTVKKDSKTNETLLQFSGDQRKNIKDFLVSLKIVDDDKITIHGY